MACGGCAKRKAAIVKLARTVARVVVPERWITAPTVPAGGYPPIPQPLPPPPPAPPPPPDRRSSR